MDGERITTVERIPADSTYLFTVRDHDGDEEKEAILIRSNGEVWGWLNYCRHLTHVELDKGSGAPIREGEVVCTNHGAMFETDTGLCTFGPCEGAYLEEIEVAVAGGSVYLVDSDYAFVREGPIEDDPLDRSSSSNVEF